jgi:hypothetical protein
MPAAVVIHRSERNARLAAKLRTAHSAVPVLLDDSRDLLPASPYSHAGYLNATAARRSTGVGHTLASLPPDTRPSALYLIAHQGTLKAPRPVEVQHMRIRRYMDLLGERRGIHHRYDEAHDIYVDLNFT